MMCLVWMLLGCYMRANSVLATATCSGGRALEPWVSASVSAWILMNCDPGEGLEWFQGQLYESCLEHREAVKSGRRRSGKY